MPPYDQRGISRPQSAGCDIGAFEARFAVTLDNRSVEENKSFGAFVGTLGIEPDLGGTYTYTVSYGGTNFGISGNTLVTRKIFDFESDNSYIVRVSASGGGVSFETQFTVRVVNIHEDPDNIGPGEMSIYENLPEDTPVCDLVTYPDTDDSYTYELVTGDGDDDNHLFGIAGTALIIKSVLSYADTETHTRTVRVMTTDQNGETFEKQIAVSVLHQGPTYMLLSSDSADENIPNTPEGTLIGDFSVEPDLGYGLTYETVPGAGSGDNALFFIEGAALKTSETFDCETKQSYSIRVRVTDSEDASYERPFLITVNNLHEPPDRIDLSSDTVTEEQPAGTVVGVLTAGPDTDDEYTYEVISGGVNFAVEEDRLVTAAVFEYVEFTNNEYTVQVKVTDENSETFTQTFTITVLETVPNNAPNGITLSSTVADAESPSDTVVGTFTVTDPDPDDTHICTLTAGTGDADNSYFKIVGADILKTAQAFDEMQSSCSILVLCEDGRGGDLEKNFTVTLVTNRPPTGITLFPTEADEGPSGITVGEFSAADPDSPGDTETFTLLSGTGVFRIDGNRLVTTAPLDSVTQSSHGIRVRVTDSGGESYDESFTVNVLNVNDPPTDIFPDEPSVPENQPAGTPVAVLTADDPDPGDTHTFILAEGDGDAANGLFVIDSGTLLTDVIFDYEAEDSHSIRVRAEDAEGAVFEKILTVRIEDVNEPPSDMRINGSDGENFRLSVPENQPPGVVVGRLGVSDPDTGDAHTFYRVVHAHRGWADNGSFILERDGIRIPPFYEGNTLLTAASSDYETKSSYDIYLRSNDSGGLSCFRMFTIYVEDVNEPPTGLTLNPGWVEEEQPEGTRAGTLAAQGDPDGDETHTYTLVSGDGDEDNARFVIEDNILRTAQVLNFEAGEHPFHIRVRTEDSGGLAHEEELTVRLGDINDPPTDISLTGNSADERMPAGTTVGILGAADPDDPEGVGLYRYELTEDCPDNEYFTVTDGILATAAVSDYGIRENLTVCVSVTDDDGGELTEEFDIAVIPHEAPVISPGMVAILDPITEKERDSSGNSIPEILGSRPVTLADGSAPPGIAVTSVSNIHGIWQYSVNSGQSWTVFTYAEGRAVDISDTARLLPADEMYRIRFVPYPLNEGDITASLTFRIWDMSEGTAGRTADATKYGGRTPFSTETAQGTVTVSEVTDIYEVHMSGMVMDMNGDPVPGVAIEIFTDGGEAVARGGTRRDGLYEIFGNTSYTENRVYTVRVQPPKSIPPYNEYNILTESISFTGSGSLTRDMIMSRPGVICGQVCDKDGTPVSGAEISLYSRDSGVWKTTETGADGTYSFGDLPDAPDYAVRVVAEGHSSDWKAGRSPGASVTFRLSASAEITGCVRDEVGASLASVTVEIRSESSDYERATATGGDGCYEFPDIPADETYEITLLKVGYVSRSEYGVRAGDEADFTLTGGDRLAGTVTDSEGVPPPDGVIVLVKIFRHDSWGCIGRTQADAGGNFEFTGLDAGTAYRLDFKAYYSDMPEQWAGENALGISDSGDAGAYSPGETLNFKFDRPW